MKQIFKPIYLLTAISAWITWCCAALLEWDFSHNLITHSYSVWGDWSAHFTFISNLLERGPSFLWGDNPAFANVPFQYPFLSHVITAIIAWVTRMSVVNSTYWTSLILMFALPFCLFYWFRSLKVKPWTSVVACALFLFIGGFQFFDSTLNPSEPLTNQFQKGSIFTQFIAFEFFPQRAFLFGLIAFTLIGGWLLRKMDQNQIQRKHLVWAGLGIALTSLLHLHTWLAFAAILLAYFAFQPKPALRKPTLYFGMAVAAISAVFLSFLLMRGHANDLRLTWNWWQPGWAQNQKAGMPAAAEMNFFYFWIFNTGIFLPLAALGFWIVRKQAELRPVFYAGLLIFIIALTLNIQPYFYDNLKLFTYSFLFFAPFVALALEPLFRQKYLFPAGLILLALQCAAGIADLEFLRSGHQTTTFFANYEFDLANEFKTLRQSPNDRVLINPRHNHWVSCLTGNPLIMGYPGWLWSWGINYGEREREVQAVLLGKENMLQVVKNLEVAYIIVNAREQIANQPINLDALRANYPVILSKNDWLIFSTRSPSSSVR
jgi:hypothetical protein